jgi:8-oxo-dGTP diphosphatase
MHHSSATLIIFDSKVLILRRGKTAPWKPGYWNLPGGQVDKGETYIATAIRECVEETGIDIEHAGGLDEYCVIYDPEYILHMYVIHMESKPEVTLCWENDKYKWLELKNINRYDFVPYVKNLIKSVISA